MPETPLVKIGRIQFRFQCQPGCSACCEQPGEVFLAPEDEPRIARFLGLSIERFRERYCEPDGDEPRLTIPDDKACHFLEEGRCTIHEAKPLQCRTFPFWPENVKTKSAWTRVARYCPGIGEGEPLNQDEVRSQVEECAASFPDLEG